MKSKEAKLNLIKVHQMKERRREIEEEVSRLEGEIAGYERAMANYNISRIKLSARANYSAPAAPIWKCS